MRASRSGYFAGVGSGAACHEFGRLAQGFASLLYLTL